MDIFAYIYINEPEIDCLYAQHVKWIVSERLDSEKKTIKGGVSAKAFGTGIDVGGDKEIESTDKKELSFSHKVEQIKNALESSKNLFHQIKEAINATEMGRRVYIDATLRFIAPQFKEADATDLVNREGNVMLESQIEQYFIIMSLGLANMPRLRGHSMSRTCHDAILFREITDHGFNFNIFGSLHKISPNKLQIRPIIIAL